MTIRASTIGYRAELTIGTRHGYEGAEVVTPGSLIPLIEQFQATREPWLAVAVWTRGTVILGPGHQTETVIKVSLESNPLYTPHASEQDVTEYAFALACSLGHALQQVRVYVAVQPIYLMIVEPASFPLDK